MIAPDTLILDQNEAMSGSFLPSLYLPLAEVDLTSINPHQNKHLQKNANISWLDNNGHSPAASQLLSCGNNYIHLKCQNNHQKVVRLYCNNEFCTICGLVGSRTHKTRISYAMDRLVWAPILGYYVFTLPAKEGASYLTRDQLNAIGKGAYEIVKRILKIDGAMVRAHLAGDNPGRLRIHFNIVFPLLGTNGLGLISPADREAVRQAWTAFINKQFSLTLKETDCNYSFAPTRGKMIHVINYVLRPVVDAFQFMTLSDGDKAYYMSLRKWHNTRWFGKLSNALYKKYLIEKGVDPVQHVQKDPYLSNDCPVCNCRFKYVGIISKADILWQHFRRLDESVAVDLEVYAALRDKEAIK